LLKDARRDVSPDIETQMIARYITASGSDRQAFETAYHVLGLQRNLRILGVFARLSFLHNKPGYVDFIPRVWAAPALTAALPPPTPDILESLKAQCGTHRTP